MPRNDPPADSPATLPEEDSLAGGGECGVLLRSLDWSASPLGPPDGWPQSLRTTVSLLLNSRYPMFVFWGPARVKIYNDAYRPITGDKHPWAFGRPGPEVWPEIWEDIRPLVDRATAGEATWSDDLLLFMHRRGFPEEVYFTFSYSPVRDESGGVAGMFCACTETTSKVLGERRLATLRDLAARPADARTIADACAWSAAVLETNPRDLPFALIYLLDERGRTARLAAAAGVAHGHPLAPAVVDDTDEAAWPVVRVAARRGGEHLDDIAARFPDRPARPWPEPPSAAMLLPLLDRGQQQPVGVIVLGISPRREFDADYRSWFELVAGQVASSLANARAHEEERRRAELLAELDRAKTLFFSNVSHEFRTPLTLMFGPVEDVLAGAHGPVPPGAAQALRVAHRNTLRLLKLVNTLLDFSRIEAGRIDASYAPTDLATVTAHLASVFRSAVERAGLRLVVDTPPLPEPVYVDRDMWEKIVLNLLSNAFKFTLEGEIRVTQGWRDGFVELTVRDTGVGIAAADLPRVFERFHRVTHARARTQEGTGIGLALVQELVRLHGGEVFVESQEGRGTTFTIRIPTGTAHLPPERIAAARRLPATGLGADPFVEEARRWLPGGAGEPDDVDPAGLEALAAALPPPERAGPAAPARVLIADDNADMREYLRRLLERVYEVEAVADGRAALERLWARPFDLVLIDVMMPHVDGFGVLSAIRGTERTRAVPVIMLSARAGEEARIEGLQAGADDYLIKPFSARELLARIASQLELARVRREAEQALRYRSEQYQTLLQQAPLGVYLVDADFRIREVNPVALPTFGDIPGGVVGRDLSEIIHRLWEPRYADEVVRIFRHTLETGEPYIAPERAEFRIDREVTEYYEWRLDRIQLPDGRVGVVCYFRDISASVHARQEIARAEALARRQKEALELAVAGAPIGAVLDVLARAAQEQSPEGTRVAIFLAEAGSGRFRVRASASLLEGHVAVLNQGELGALSWGVVAHTGQSSIVPDVGVDTRWGPALELARELGVRACWSFPIRSFGGVVLGVFALYHAASREPEPRHMESIHLLAHTATILIERDRAAEESRRAEAALRAADRAKDEFLAMLGHELRNPLGALASAARVLEVAERSAEGAPQARAVIERQIAHLTRLVDDLLDVSRVTTAKVRLSRRPLDLAEAGRAAVESLRTRGALARHEVTFEARPAWVDGDETRLEQIVVNLVGNATKFTPAGGRISVRVEPEGAEAVITVTDTGAGIAPDALPTIFDLFVQGERTLDRTQGGLGIGLTLVRRLVELHGGSVHASSAGLGRGSTFTVRLPAVPVPSPLPAAPPPRPDVGRCRVLLVEDNEDVRLMLRVALAADGHDVHDAADGPDGIEAALALQPDVALIDVGLPGLDGYAVARAIGARAGERRPYLVALTGYGQPEDRRRAQEAGFDAHVVKPVDPRLLAALLAARKRPDS